MMEIVKKIARTSMNEVWEGNYNGIRVAVKKPIHEDMIKLLRFVKESKYWKEVSDLGIDGVVKVIEIDDDEPWCAVEFINGRTLEEELKNADMREIANRMLEVLNILQIVHSQGYLHLDIKPSNIFVDEYGDVQITDWGLAARIFRKLADDVYTFIGTPSYAPPELWDPETYGKPDIRSDIYEIGTTFYKILTKQVPFQNRNEALDGDLREFPERVPGKLRRIIVKAVSPDRNDRYSNAREMYKDIQDWLQEEKILWRGIYKIKFEHILQITKNHGFSFVADYPKIKRNTIAMIDEERIKAFRDGVFINYGIKKRVNTDTTIYHGAEITYKKEEIGRIDLGLRDVVHVDFPSKDIEVARKYFEFLQFLKEKGIKISFKRGRDKVNLAATKVLIKNEVPNVDIDAVIRTGIRRVHLRLFPDERLDADIVVEGIKDDVKILEDIARCRV